MNEPAAGLEPRRKRLDDALAASGFSGVVTVDVGQRRTLELCRGFAHRAFKVPNRPTTRFGIASGSKAFTALMVRRLVERGEVGLDQPVRAFLGEDLPLIDDRVTLAHLLEHTSGIGDYLDEEADWQPDDYVLSLPVHSLTTAQSLLPMLDGLPQVFEPGARFSYNNGGYVVLGIVIERVTGMPVQDAIERDVLAPAGLAATGFLRLDELPADAARGYLYESGDRVNTLHLPVRGSADGGAFTHAADLHAFWRALFTDRILPGAVVSSMMAPLHHDQGEGLDYGQGFYVHGSGRAVVLMGCDAGVSFQTWHLPEAETTVSVLANTSSGAWPVVAALAADVDECLEGADPAGARPVEDRPPVPPGPARPLP